MNRLIHLSVLMAALGLAACDRTAVVAVPVPVPVAVPGPAGPAGATGATGDAGQQGNRGDDGRKGEIGKTGDGSTTVIVIPPVASAPTS